MRPLLAVSALAIVLTFAPCAARVEADQAAPPSGSVIVSQTSPDAVLLWDVSVPVSQGATLATIESDAVRIAATYAPNLTAAKNVTVRVIYAKTGYVSPAFSTVTYGGTERLLTVTLSVGDAIKNGAQYAEQLAHGIVPNAVAIVVQGRLPPQPSSSPGARRG
jgi:hypothetical protein